MLPSSILLLSLNVFRSLGTLYILLWNFSFWCLQKSVLYPTMFYQMVLIINTPHVQWLQISLYRSATFLPSLSTTVLSAACLTRTLLHLRSGRSRFVWQVDFFRRTSWFVSRLTSEGSKERFLCDWSSHSAVCPHRVYSPVTATWRGVGTLYSPSIFVTESANTTLRTCERAGTCDRCGLCSWSSSALDSCVGTDGTVYGPPTNACLDGQTADADGVCCPPEAMDCQSVCGGDYVLGLSLTNRPSCCNRLVIEGGVDNQ